jgi:hypothetical protein
MLTRVHNRKGVEIDKLIIYQINLIIPRESILSRLAK